MANSPEMTARIKAAVENAELAFWAEIAKAFPEVTTGDFDPLDSFEITEAMTKAVTRWIGWNHPDHQEGDAA